MRTLSRKVLAVMAAILLVLVAFTLYLQFTSGTQAGGSWIADPAYPLQVNGTAGVVGQSCANSTSYISCVGGQDAVGDPSNTVYSAPLILSGGILNWTSMGDLYPQAIMFESCAGYSGYVYCVGGTHDGQGDDTASVYYAHLSPSGPGSWSSTTPYPVPIDGQTCSASSGYIYCVGGENETGGTNATSAFTDSAWYAKLSASGVGTWAKTTPYPRDTYFPSCSTFASYIYCVAGEDASQNPQNMTYYAALSSDGVGPWTRSTPYPIDVLAAGCTASSSYVYCVGGFQSGGTTSSSVYYAPLTRTGMGTWKQAGDYPTGIATACAGSSSYLYCIGGFVSDSGVTGDVYHSRLVGSSSSSSSSTISSLPLPSGTSSSGDGGIVIGNLQVGVPSRLEPGAYR